MGDKSDESGIGVFRLEQPVDSKQSDYYQTEFRYYYN